MSSDDRKLARDAYQKLGDDELASWDLVSEMHDWANLLVGNGASLAVWDGFAYNSLYDAAQVSGLLDDADVSVFGALQTTNFEGALRALLTSATIAEALGLDRDEFDERYESTRTALVSAVHAAHVPWAEVPTSTLEQIKHELLAYDTIFSTNYDLLLYWAAMADEPRGSLPDFFWSADLVFDQLDTEVWQKATKLLFLHGGLHLVRLPNLGTAKRRASPAGNLLESFADAGDETQPLFVSEGEASDKLASIRSSDYLSFALRTFDQATQPLVVFGHSLSEQDQHLVDIIRRLEAPIAFALRDPEDRTEQRAIRATLGVRLRKQKLLFFDAATHPLGDPDLHIESS